MQQDCFAIEMSVRDYECDMQYVVNNAVYQHYLEHARHEYLKSIGIDFAQLTAQGINLVIIRAEIDYRQSLVSGDHFVVELSPLQLSPVRIGFNQRILRLPDRKPVVTALFTGTALNIKGRPHIPDALAELFRRARNSSP